MVTGPTNTRACRRDAIQALEERRTRPDGALAVLLRQIHEAADTDVLPPQVEAVAHTLTEQISAPAHRGWRRLVPFGATAQAREAAAVAELLRTIDQMQCTDPIRGAAAHLTGILTDHRLPDTA